MDWGDSENAIRNAAEEAGLPVPVTIAESPKVTGGQLFYYEAFNDLHTTRSCGFDIGPIPWTAISEYANRYQLYDEDEFSLFKNVIREVDVAYMRFAKEKIKAKSKGKT